MRNVFLGTTAFAAVVLQRLADVDLGALVQGLDALDRVMEDLSRE